MHEQVAGRADVLRVVGAEHLATARLEPERPQVEQLPVACQVPLSKDRAVVHLRLCLSQVEEGQLPIVVDPDLLPLHIGQEGKRQLDKLQVVEHAQVPSEGSQLRQHDPPEAFVPRDPHVPKDAPQVRHCHDREVATVALELQRGGLSDDGQLETRNHLVPLQPDRTPHNPELRDKDGDVPGSGRQPRLQQEVSSPQLLKLRHLHVNVVLEPRQDQVSPYPVQGRELDPGSAAEGDPAEDDGAVDLAEPVQAEGRPSKPRGIALLEQERRVAEVVVVLQPIHCCTCAGVIGADTDDGRPVPDADPLSFKAEQARRPVDPVLKLLHAPLVYQELLVGADIGVGVLVDEDAALPVDKLEQRRDRKLLRENQARGPVLDLHEDRVAANVPPLYREPDTPHDGFRCEDAEGVKDVPPGHGSGLLHRELDDDSPKGRHRRVVVRDVPIGGVEELHVVADGAKHDAGRHGLRGPLPGAHDVVAAGAEHPRPLRLSGRHGDVDALKVEAQLRDPLHDRGALVDAVDDEHLRTRRRRIQEHLIPEASVIAAVDPPAPDLGFPSIRVDDLCRALPLLKHVFYPSLERPC
uniref:Uncharacterized protein n=1 Tax=Tetraselmis sp. GSL018 TaxID=582737 RepID=A0A061S2W8_9CHLO|mmetsp:Transcript_42053/g.99695  ORF Transcript_42053/g.99695 Transcript_42053/m.99695 type:complete len:580 (+) Transcript_42053:1462-3201(+)